MAKDNIMMQQLVSYTMECINMVNWMGMGK